jgi:hypothetical protein
MNGLVVTSNALANMWVQNKGLAASNIVAAERWFPAKILSPTQIQLQAQVAPVL